MRRLLTVAGLTIRTALRLRAFWVVAAALAAVVLLLPPSLRDDGTLPGRLRLLLSYTLGLAHAMLCLAALWLGADSLAREVGEEQIQLVVTKPISRPVVWLGKWLGLTAICAVLTAGAGGATLWQLRRTLADERWRDEDRQLARQEVLTARAEILATAPDFGAEAERIVSERLRGGALSADDNLLRARQALRDALEAEWQNVLPGAAKVWEFQGVAPPAGTETVWYRFRARAASWLPNNAARVAWEVRGSRHERLVTDGDLLPDTTMAIRIPSELVGPDGRLAVRLRNDSRSALVFALPDGPKVLYEVGGFAGNLQRGLLILAGQQAVLVAFGLLLGSAMSFPVATFASLSYLLCAAHAPFLRGRLAGGEALFGLGSTPIWVEYAGRGLAAVGLWLSSTVHLHAPMSRISTGIVVPWAEVGAAAWQLGLLQFGLAAAAGTLLFGRRELALGGDR